MELMIVLAIIIIAVAIIVPLVGAMRYTRIQAGEQTVTVAADAARRYATRPQRLIEVNGQPIEYRDTAILFTPSGELRIIETEPFAMDNNRYLAVDFRPEVYYGYRDIPGRDYIPLPRGVGVVGIVRTGSGPDDIKFIAPPFAVRFDNYGRLLVANRDPESRMRMVYYDGNYTYDYRRNDGRPSDYDPAPYDPRHLLFDPANFIAGPSSEPINKYRVPFDRIECVLGVYIFDKETLYDLLENGLQADGSGYVNDDAAEWIRENGKALFFNRYTGRVIR